MKAVRDESGQVLVFTAMCIMVLVGFLALATDVGYLLNRKRQIQSAADCAAVAAAAAVKTYAVDGYSTTAAAAKAAAVAAAKQNGFDSTTKDSTVTVTSNNAPLNGPYKGNASYAEVFVQQTAPTFFMRAFGNNTETVAARAVAGFVGGSGCLYALGSTGTDVAVNGTASVNASGCNFYDNSSSSGSSSTPALKTSGANASLTAKSINIVGGYSGSNISPNPPTTGAASSGDPLSYLPAPTAGTCAGSTSITSGNLSYGCYDGLSINGTGTVNLAAGTYYINGNLSISGSGTVNGTGVTFYVTGSTTINGGSTLNLTAPSSGTYDGILLFQSRSDTNAMTFSGGASSNLKGIIYAPTTSMLTFSGNGSGNTYVSVVVGAVTFTGTSNLKDYALENGTTPLGKTALVE